MTFSKSSPPPADPHNGLVQFHHHRHPLYSTPPQLTLIDALMMQAQAQAPPSGDFATMPLWTRGNAVPSSSEERRALALATMIAVLNEDSIPSSRDGNFGDGHNSPSEPSAQQTSEALPRRGIAHEVPRWNGLSSDEEQQHKIVGKSFYNK
jgi:hypothetical protein